MKVSIIVPCYNEEEVIQTTYDRIHKVMIDNLYDHELVFINDGSRDTSMQKLRAIALLDASVCVISFSRNFGHQPAVTAGLNHCTGDIAIIIDADLQDPPELFPEMIALYQEKKCNVVYGVRNRRKGETWFKKVSAKLFYRLINFMSDVRLPKDTGDFRLIDRQVIDEFNKLKERNKYIRGLISWLGFVQEPFYYDRDPRLVGQTKYPFRKMLKFAMTGILYFTKKPLKMAMSIGFTCVFFGLVLSAYVVFRKLFQPDEVVPGWASMVITIIFFGGIQLLSIGILGQYIGNMFDEIKQRPEYIVHHKINIE